MQRRRTEDESSEGWVVELKRVAVLGAGLAGLAAARQLAKSGEDVTVYEARSRAGGRVWSDSVGVDGREYVVERGAEFILDGYSSMRRLLVEAGLELVDTGMSYYVREPGDYPAVTTDDIVALGRVAVAVADKLGGAPSAEEVISRLRGQRDVIEALRARIEISTAVSAHAVTATSLESIAAFEPKPSWRVAGGNQQLPNIMAERLGDSIRFGSSVLHVENLEGGGVRVADGVDSETFDAVVVALPLAVVKDPATITLPSNSAREEALCGVVQGHAVKLHVPLVAVPHSSAVMSVRDRYWTWTALDATGTVAPVLNGFMGSKEAIDRAGVVNSPKWWAEQVRRLRPELEIPAEAEILTTIWSEDPLARGAYSAHAPREGRSRFPAHVLEQPIGNVFWAGEYADAEFTGLMEGAIRSGERAADRVHAQLKNQSDPAPARNSA